MHARDETPTLPLRTIFFGSGPFAIPVLKAVMNRSEIEILAVITPPDGPVGRRGVLTAVPLAVAAELDGLHVERIKRVRADAAVEMIRTLAPDLGILADFGQLIPQAVIDVPTHGILNVHPSLLPRHRGATPIPATILAGDTQAGVTIMQMDAGLDTGPIVAARSWQLDGTEDGIGLESTAAVEGAGLLDDVITALLAGSLSSVAQDASAASLTRPLQRSDGRLDPSRSAVELERRIRALRPWPGTFLEIEGRRVVVHEVAVAVREPGDVPGGLVPHGDGIALTTANGRLILETVQPAGGRSMPGSAFRRGHPSVVGADVDPAPTLAHSRVHA